MRTLFFVLAFFTVSASIALADKPAAAAPRPHVAVMVSDDHYKADTLLPPLLEKMAEKNDWQLTVLHGKGGSDFPNIAALETADVLIVFVRRLALPKKQLAAVKKYVASGRGVIGLRTASHAFEMKGKIPDGCENWPGFDRDVLGGNYHNHGKDALGSDIANVAEQADSPILRGVTPAKWHSTGSLYFTGPLATGATVYQTAGSPERPNEPLTWTRMHGKTRVAYTALGHPDDYKEPAFRQLLENLIRWAMEKEVRP